MSVRPASLSGGDEFFAGVFWTLTELTCPVDVSQPFDSMRLDFDSAAARVETD